VEQFARQYRAIFYSRRYHYPNPWTGDGTDYTPSLHAEDLIAFIEALQHGPINMVGNSFGAYTTLVAAIRRPDLIQKMVIGEPPILPWLKDVPGGQVYWDGFMNSAWLPAKQAFQNGDLEKGVQLFVDGVSGKGDYERLPETVRARFLENARSLQAETISPEYFTEITPQQIRQIAVPTLFLKGEQSPKMFHLIVDRLIQSASNPREATIPNASHAMYSGNPQAYYAVVADYLAG
jgi:pimeloyl-ACP methyl ester carboxylesterase